ncbi:hypothetical protein ZIOFF_007864 [Zingiber officinale]|uniref:Uncharacterized protein n=1 Tax=Zingiber officinale TaxID=94328 RepID=A0A8J5LTA5_ZINOF|nr:hypothetical protein ZIOFF_007864 [Zingiber officinale]
MPHLLFFSARTSSPPPCLSPRATPPLLLRAHLFSGDSSYSDGSLLLPSPAPSYAALLFQLLRLDVQHQHINMSNVQVDLARDAQSFLNDEDEDTEIDSDTDDQLSLSDDSAMPPKRIEHLLVLETPIDDSSSSVRLRDECILSQNSEDVIDVVQIADTICDQVLGTRSGYIRGLGSGPKPVRSTSSDVTSSSRSTNAVLRERLQSTQDELANTKIQLANTNELASIKSRQDLFEQILNRLAPGALDSLIHDSSPAPPPPSSS